jgi:hypothetical protein
MFRAIKFVSREIIAPGAETRSVISSFLPIFKKAPFPALVCFLEPVFRTPGPVLRTLEMILRTLEMILRTLEMISRRLEMISRTLETISRTLEMIPRILEPAQRTPATRLLSIARRLRRKTAACACGTDEIRAARRRNPGTGIND